MSTNQQIATIGDHTPAAIPGDNLSGDAVATLMEHAKAMKAAHDLAVAMCGSDLVPAIYKGKPDNGAAAILYGAELGLTPIQSMQQIFVVHNTPAIYARTMVALVTARGHEVWESESSPESVTVCGRRRGSDVVTQSTWTYERARKAGYTSNKKYDTDPQAMLYAKAATEVCRKMAPDILLGIAYSREELEMEPRRVASARVEAPARGVSGLRDKLGVAPEEQEAPKVEQSEEGPAVVEASSSELKDMIALLGDAGYEGKDAVLSHVSSVLGREVLATRGLSSVDVATVLDHLAGQMGGDQ
ncbi:MAG: hypothetical protein M1337_02360 [Actinobacteria bacterium]|nr:hypothetical protein [Actinomycetota bacterium]